MTNTAPFARLQCSYKAGGILQHVHYNSKWTIVIFWSGLISQVVSREGGLMKQGPLYMIYIFAAPPSILSIIQEKLISICMS